MSKFKVGERAKIVDPAEMLRGRECTIQAIEHSPFPEKEIRGLVYYRVIILGEPPTWVSEQCLRKMLPDADTYHPADTSIDDLMRSLRETETA